MTKITLGDLCAPAAKQVKLQPDDSVDYFDISSLDNISKSIIKYETYLFADAPSRARKPLKCGNILVSTVRPNLNAVAIFDQSTENFPIASTGFCVLECKPTVNPRFVFNFCRSNAFIEQMTAQATGASYPAVTDKIVRNATLPDYSIMQQNEIAHVLDSLSNIITNRKQQLAKLDELIKARFVEMFGDPYTNSKDYPLKKGESFFKLSNGKAVPESKRLNGGIPAYGGNGISWYTDESLFDADTIVVGRVGFQSGNVHLVKGPLWVTDNAMYMSSCDFSQYNLTFLIELMAHIDFTKFQDAGDLKKITQKPFMQFEYLCPPLSLQNQFAAFVAEVDKSKVEVQKALDQTQLLFDSLMQQYFG